MKKSFLLSVYLASFCSVSACSTFSGSDSQETPFIAENDAPVIDATVNPNDRCGVNGISCNDTALVNYTKTEADYRAYGERTKRDHLYTQSSAGNNLTATIQPGLEEDVVKAPVTFAPKSASVSPIDDGVFRETQPLDLEANTGISDVPVADGNNEVGHASNIETITFENNGSPYEIICEEQCDDYLDNDADDDSITSEFTEDSFDIADYADDGNIEFTDIGNKKELPTDIDINEIKVSDDTILTWEAEEGDNLRELLTKWSTMSGWKLLWNTNRNYILTAGVMFKGKFADVSSALIRAFARARPAPIATYYKGNRVIVVETMENENAY